MSSLRSRLLVGTSLATAVVLLTAGVALDALIRSTLHAHLDHGLASTARSFAALAEQEGGRLELEFAEAALPEFEPSQSAQYYQVWLEDGTVAARSRSLGDAELARIAGAPGVPVFSDTTLADGRPGRAVGLTFTPRQEIQPWRETPALTVTLVLARGVEHLEATLTRIRVVLIGLGLAAVALSAAVLAWVVRRGLSPIERLGAQIAAVEHSDLARISHQLPAADGDTPHPATSSRLGVLDVLSSTPARPSGRKRHWARRLAALATKPGEKCGLAARLDPAGTPRELLPVVDRLNELLARLGAAFARERRFTGDVAHELRTPLAGLRSTVEVALSREREPLAYREALHTCLTIDLQMQRMVESLLHLARADAGQLELRHEELELSEVIGDAWAGLDAEATKRHLSIEWSVDGVDTIESDRDMLRLVLHSVLTNAVAYTDKGGSISVATVAGAGSVEVTVRNTGCALEAESVHQVFERFWRGNAMEGHCGLGLALARAVVEQLGGTIEATADHGLFTISIRLQRT